LNEIIDKLDKETQKKLSDLFQKAEKKQSEMKFNLDENKNEERIQHNYNANSWTQVDKISSTISGKLANDSDSSRRVEILKEDVAKLLVESKNHVQWSGEIFVPKPMQLSQINLVKFHDSQSFQERNVRVRYTNAELSAPIKLMEHAELTVTDEWNNLKEQLKGY
jgi:restriction endonuclease S subunit